MTEPEGLNPERPATPDQLSELQRKTSEWLDANGKLFIDGDTDEPGEAETLGLYNGLPINDGLPRLRIDVPGDVVHSVATVAAERLEVGESMSIISWLPHYATTENPDEFDFMPGRISFVIRKAPGKEIVEEELYVEPNSDGTGWTSDRMTESRNPTHLPIPEDRTLEDIVAKVGMDIVFNKKLGTNLITNREWEDLNEIVNGLDAMKAMIPEAA